jgi:Universal stress protein family
MVKHVLVAVGSDLSEGTLSAGISRARENGARLTLLHVVDSMPWWALAGEHGCAELLAAVDQQAHAVEQHCKDAIERAALDTAAQTPMRRTNSTPILSWSVPERNRAGASGSSGPATPLRVAQAVQC